MKRAGWKWDVEIYNRPGWGSFTYGFPGMGAIQKRENNQLVIRFDSSDEHGINDDFYCEHYREVIMSSTDGGMSWEEMERDWVHHPPLVLSDGSLIEVVDSRRLKTRQQEKARLEELGIAHVWRDDCALNWELWPENMAAELRAQGLTVWDNKGGEAIDQTYLPDGVVATHAPSAMVARKSTDGGSSWREDVILKAESFSHFVCCFAGSVALPDDTMLIPCYGVARSKTAGEGFSLAGSVQLVLRSQDRGGTYQLIEMGGPPEAHLNECCLVHLGGERIIAIIRGTTTYQSISEDGGRTWSQPRPTGMTGSPLHAIALRSGSLLCAYAHRDHPGGIRATLSHDGGRSWDVDNEKILRDDSLPSSYIGGPGSVQLDDDSIFTFYNLVKAAEPKQGDQLTGGPLVLNRRFHCYIAGSRYTEDYAGPAGSR